VVATRVHGLDYGLSIGSIVWADGGGDASSGGGENGWGECDSVKVCALGYRRVLEDNEKTGVVLPLDFKTSIHVLIIGESDLNILRLEFLGEACEVENAGDRG